MAAIGYFAAVLSAAFNGSFAAVFKTKRVAAANLDPLLFQLYVSVGVFCSSWLVLPFLSYNTAIDPEA